MSKEFLGRINYRKELESAEKVIFKKHNITITTLKEKEIAEKRYKEEIKEEYKKKLQNIIDSYTKYQRKLLVYLNELYDNENSFLSIWDLYVNNILYDEINKEKFLYEFTESELKTLIKSSVSYQINSKKKLFYFIRQYCKWAIDRGDILIDPSINLPSDLCESINIKSLKDDLIALNDFQEKCELILSTKSINPMSIMYLIFARYGIIGKKGIYSESISINDIDFNNKIVRIIDDTTGVVLSEIPVDDFFLKWISYIITLKNYRINYSKKLKDNIIDVSKNLEFEISDKIIRKLVNHKGKSKKYSLNNIVVRFNELLGTNYTSSSLQTSRKFDFLLSIRQQRKLCITDIFYVEKLVNPTSKDSSCYALKKDYELLTNDIILTKNQIKKLYPKLNLSYTNNLILNIITEKNQLINYIDALAE